MTMDTSLPQAENQTIECANCGAAFIGSFCPACGQKADTERLSLKTMAGNLFRVIYDMDSKVWRTILDLTKQPGQVALDYIAGGRVRYINPVKYFITVYAISIALSMASGELDQNLSYTTQTDSIEEMEAEVRAEVEKDIAKVTEMLSNRMDLVTFVMVPILAILMRLHNFRAGKNLAETLSFQCFVWGHYALLSIPLILTIYLSPSFNFWVKNVLLIAMFYYALKVFYDRTWLRAVLSTVFFVLYSFIAAILSVEFLVGIQKLGIL
ncbi:MAG: DUF3667 domain-containing protein [Kordiimonadaceae bacterium]|nr:DUF3667 domain-containing protein [Kordiimonadaceae bacterium]MBO6570292.1 DUF3667 domain-containing protein [Kordiimonadaceae bacterium]MBO6965610.1 DUF3667 domain-containing protein [Kordiimonadaceae bacterium]